MRHAVIIDDLRTPIGRASAENGYYRDVRADDLSAHCMRSLVARSGIDPHLVEDVTRVGVVPVEADAPRQLHNEPEILSCVTRRLDSLAPELHHAIGVGDGAHFFRPCGCGQHDICEVCRFGQKDILNDEVIERRHRLARVIDIGI